MTLFRIELAFDGEPQNVGLFNGLDDALSDNQAEYFHGVFRNLIQVPDLPPQPTEYTFWFTRAGLVRCWYTLRHLLSTLAENNWSFLVKVVDLPSKTARSESYYNDRYQIALKEAFVKTAGQSDFREITDAKDFALILEPYMKNKDIAVKICPACKKFFTERPATSRKDGRPICPDCGMREALAVLHYTSEQQEEIIDVAWKIRKETYRES